jgi:trafficking protein particle complex subunit 3
MDLQHSILAVKSDHYDRTRVDKVNAELVTLTYGTIVAQLCRDYESDYVEVNKQLDKMGYNIGLRLIEDYLAKSNTMRRCSNFRETAEMISKARSRP